MNTTFDAFRRSTASDLLRRLPAVLARTDEAVADALRGGDTAGAQAYAAQRDEWVELGALAERVLAE